MRVARRMSRYSGEPDGPLFAAANGNERQYKAIERKAAGHEHRPRTRVFREDGWAGLRVHTGIGRRGQPGAEGQDVCCHQQTNHSFSHEGLSQYSRNEWKVEEPKDVLSIRSCYNYSRPHSKNWDWFAGGIIRPGPLHLANQSQFFA